MQSKRQSLSLIWTPYTGNEICKLPSSLCRDCADYSPIHQWLSSFLSASTNYFKTAKQMDRENVSPWPQDQQPSLLLRWPWPTREDTDPDGDMWWHLHPWSRDSVWSPPLWPAPVLKAKDGDMLGFVVKLAYITVYIGPWLPGTRGH